MTLDAQTGVLSWPTTAADVSSTAYPVTVTVSDPDGQGDTQSFDLTVKSDTTPPQVTIALSANPAPVGTHEQITLTATDDVRVTAWGLTVNGQAVTLNNQGSAVVTLNQAGDVSVVAQAEDAAGNVGTASRTISVYDPTLGLPPDLRIASSAVTSVLAGEPYSYAVQIAHLDTDVVHYSSRATSPARAPISTAPAWLPGRPRPAPRATATA